LRPRGSIKAPYSVVRRDYADDQTRPRTDRDAQWLVTTYAAVAVVLTLTIAPTAFRRGERWAWLAFWIWPVFFVVHGIVFFVVDFVFAALRSRRPLRLRAARSGRTPARTLALTTLHSRPGTTIAAS
jgi:hypothetical protein